MLKITLLCLLLNSFFVSTGLAKKKPPTDLRTNETLMHNPPIWLKRTLVEKVTDKIQYQLEWTTRQVDVYWYSNVDDFIKNHSLGPQAIAVTRSANDKTTVHLGPKVNKKNFSQIFGHELVHVIIYQKYRGAIPKWLEEGLANHLSKTEKVDYSWLAKQKFPADVTSLAHPLTGSASQVNYRYKASQALAEMLDKKCKLERLIQLSVERKMENYIKTFCEIDDINAEFKKWVLKKAKVKFTNKKPS